jgi:hypothetical protein
MMLKAGCAALSRPTGYGLSGLIKARAGSLSLAFGKKICVINKKSLTGNYHRAKSGTLTEKAKPAARRGRKATGLAEIAGLPGMRQSGFIFA